MESSELSSSKILHSVATDLAQIVSIDCTSKKAELSKELVLATQQVENNNLILNEVITNDKKVTEELPTILQQYKSLQQLFEPLDKLSRLVERVCSDVTRLEAAVSAAEQHLLGEQPNLAHRILQPVLRKLDPDALNDNNIFGTDGSFQLFNPSDYIGKSFLASDFSANPITVTTSPPVEPAVEAFCLDNLSSLRVSEFPVSSNAGFGVRSDHPNNNSSVLAEQLLLDDEELCTS